MALENLVHSNPSFLLKVVNILRHALPEEALLLQQLDEVMSWCSLVSVEIHVLRKFVESLGFLNKVGECE